MDETTGTSAADRRALLTKGSVAAAVAAAAAVGLGRSVEAGDRDGDPLHIGVANVGETETSLGGGSSFWVTNGTSKYAGQTSSIIGESGLAQAAGVMGVRLTPGYSWGYGVLGLDLGTDVESYAVYGFSDVGTGVGGSGSYDDFRADGSGRLTFAGVGVESPPVEFGEVGMLARDEQGNLWYCASEDNDGTWRKLAGASTGGAFHPITPVRTFDSRLTGGGPFGPGSDRIISIKDARSVDTGEITAGDVVPAGATAITYNLTVAGTVDAGWLFIAPGDATTVTSSSINWSSTGSLLANAGVVKLDADRQVKIFCGPAATHAIIDITGYYL